MRCQSLNKHSTHSTIINSIIWDASRQVYVMCSFKSAFVMKYSQWLNAHSLMPQDVKSPITYPVRKPVGNIQADNPAKVSQWQKKKKKKKWLFYWSQANHSEVGHSLIGLKSILALSSILRVETARSGLFVWDLNPGWETGDACRAVEGSQGKEQSSVT